MTETVTCEGRLPANDGAPDALIALEIEYTMYDESLLGNEQMNAIVCLHVLPHHCNLFSDREVAAAALWQKVVRIGLGHHASGANCQVINNGGVIDLIDANITEVGSLASNVEALKQSHGPQCLQATFSGISAALLLADTPHPSKRYN